MSNSNHYPISMSGQVRGSFLGGLAAFMRMSSKKEGILHRLLLVMMAGVMGLALVGCGGDSDTGDITGSAPLPLMKDSFGVPVPEDSFGGGDGGAAGADGSAGDGVPIPNATVRVIDSVGKSVTTRTDALGYYRVRIDGLTPPLIANVTRADGVVWYSPSISPVQSRTFTTINLTGLTDKVASDIAVRAGLSGAAKLTTAILSANPKWVQDAKAQLNADLSKQITAAGLNPATFDPVGTPFRAVLGQPYDDLLESLQITKPVADGPTKVEPIYSLGGNISGLGSRTGLSLGNGTETLIVSAGSSTFTFATSIKKGASYSVVVRSQPSGSNCVVTNGSGVMAEADVKSVVVTCDYVLGGNVTGLGNASGLILSNAGEIVSIPAANTASFAFKTALAQGSSYSVQVVTNPEGRTCSVSNGSGTVTGTSVNNVVVVSCFPNQYTLGGEIYGLTAIGNKVVLANGAETLDVLFPASNFVFETNLVSGSVYNVTVQTNPPGLVCAVLLNGSGRVTNAPITNIIVGCAPPNGLQ